MKCLFKKITYGVLFTVVFFLLFFSSSKIFAQENSGERITNFNSVIKVNIDGAINVTETISYDTGEIERHGIYRFIPVIYKTNLGNQSAQIKNILVTDENGIVQPFAVTREGNNENIKIGDPNATFFGGRTYIISYTVLRAIGFFKNYDEIYWNVTGNEWVIPIEKTSGQVILPDGVKPIQFSCYEGAFGSNEKCQAESRDNTVAFKSSAEYQPGEGLTIAVGFPKGIVSEPTRWQKIGYFIQDNSGILLIVILPLIAFIVMFRKWWKYGRDPKGTGVIVAQYDAPDNLTPLEVSAILHQSARQADISAEIIYLATKGYIKITRLEDTGFIFKKPDYLLNLLKKDKAENDFDQKLLDGLFGGFESVKMSDLKNKFYKHIKEIKSAVAVSVTEKGYYKGNPEKVFGKYFGGGMALTIGIVFVGFFFGFFAKIYFSEAVSGGAIAGLIISTIIISIFSLIMPAKTEKGVATKEYVLGLKEYLQIAEKDRLAFHNSPEKTPELFEKLLPFAMVLGVYKAWAKEFEGIYTTPPSWYNDPTMRGFSPIYFSESLTGFSKGMASVSTAPGGSSGSGGGGFSGGGGGGGGGGGW